MKLTLIFSIIQVTSCCSGFEKSNSINLENKTDSTTVIAKKDTLDFDEPLKNAILSQRTDITVSYAAIECGCPQWFESKYADVKFLDGVERFYLEPAKKSLPNANNLWDGEHLPLTLKLTGRFSMEKLSPKTYFTKSKPEKARIFFYDHIKIVSPSTDKDHP